MRRQKPKIMGCGLQEGLVRKRSPAAQLAAVRQPRESLAESLIPFPRTPIQLESPEFVILYIRPVDELNSRILGDAAW